MNTSTFSQLHSHGFLRVAAATPHASSGDVDANLQSTLQLSQQAHRNRVDLVVFPELGISSYALDDLHLQDAIQSATLLALETLVAKSSELSPVLLVGAPLERSGRLYNCAIVISRGNILGVVPKTFLPNYREYYEKRWFASGAGLRGCEMEVLGRKVPFGTDLIFSASDLRDFTFHVELCEDYWAPTPPSSEGALAGALVLCNLSASNIVVGKARERRLLGASQSARAVAAYVYSAAGPGESTTDVAWDGQSMIHELGELLIESDRFREKPDLIFADVDLQKLRLERMRNGTFNDAAAFAGHPETRFRRVIFAYEPPTEDVCLARPVARFPFVPSTQEHLDEDCFEAFNIQVEGLARRFSATPGDKMLVGVSGGLDSTHALIVAAKVCDRLKLQRKTLLGFTMPGFATGESTKKNAWALMDALGIFGEEIDIRPAAQQMLADMKHPFASGEPVYDITFENVQAGLRTDYLFRLANQRNGLVVGTGDMSELALGWCTYGVGDQMSHYAVNCGVPKTLMQFLIRWCIRTSQFDEKTHRVLELIVQTKISPELIPADDSGDLQSTESKVGPYELNDFFMHHVVRYGLPPSKVAFLAWHAWRDQTTGTWPAGIHGPLRHEYDLKTIRYWLKNFLIRFFQTSQFKRSALPNGPKVSALGALSPRGDWRAPADGTAQAWLDELECALPESTFL